MGLPGMGTHRAQPRLAEPGSRLLPSAAAGREARPRRRWVPAQQAEMLSTPGCRVPLAPGRPVPEGRAPTAPHTGVCGDLLLRAASAAAHAGSPQGGGSLLRHDLLALPLSAQGRNQVLCSTTAALWWQDQAQPRSRDADGNNLPQAQASRAMLTLPGMGRLRTSTTGEPLFLQG